MSPKRKRRLDKIKRAVSDLESSLLTLGRLETSSGQPIVSREISNRSFRYLYYLERLARKEEA